MIHFWDAATVKHVLSDKRVTILHKTVTIQYDYSLTTVKQNELLEEYEKD